VFASVSSALLFLGFAVFLALVLLIGYALRRNDEVRARLSHGKTIFELETKRRSEES
jgi:hypothetical protein